MRTFIGQSCLVVLLGLGFQAHAQVNAPTTQATLDPGPPAPYAGATPTEATPATSSPFGLNCARWWRACQQTSGAPFAETTNRVSDDTPHLQIPSVGGFSFRFLGYFWADTGYLSRVNAQDSQPDESKAYMQGRFVLGAAVTRTFEDYYATAKVELIGFVNEYANSAYEPHTLDAYVRVGHLKWWDVQVGRFLAWEVYHRGQGIEWWTAEEAGTEKGPKLYWLDQAQGYRNESGQAAFHFYPLDVLKFEVAGVYGTELKQNNFGVRPVAIFTWKDLQIAAGYELLALRPQTASDKGRTTTQGFAGRVQYTFFDHVTAGANFGQTFVTDVDLNGDVRTDTSVNKYSVGGFVDIDFWRNSIGLGYHYTNSLDQRQEDNTQQQAFVSYRLNLPIQGLSLKAVYGFALSHMEDSTVRKTWEDHVHSVRLRLSYEFN